MTTNNIESVLVLGKDKASTVEVDVSHISGVWVAAHDNDATASVNLSSQSIRALRDWMTDYLGDENADDDWEKVTDWDNHPPRPGDEVAVTHTVGGVTVTRQGTYKHLDSCRVARTPTDKVIGNIERGTWRVRRAPEPDPDDVLTPGTILRYVSTTDGTSSDVAQVDSESECAIGVWIDGTYGKDTCDLSAFTVESTGDRWEKQDGRWTVAKKEHRND